uniref:Uncharacterized protein n=1 Tax=Plectus sambesii TaxID=2011161 RepID=A0A914VE81_9BILA
MVLYGGVDYQQSLNNEIIRFSSMNDVISPMQVAGSVFLVLLSPGSVINLSFQTSSYYFNYNPWGSVEKGYVLRYDVGSLCSPPASPPSTSPPGPSNSGSHGLNSAWICIIIVAVCVVIAVVASLISSSWKRSNPLPRPNNANATVPPVHFVSSQPNHGDAPPSYEEAMKYSTPTTSMYSNRCANVIILHA